MSTVPFIVPIEGGGGFEVTAEARTLLATIDGPIAVVAVAGLFRTGKSFLLNRLLGRQAAFAVGGTVEACTVGVSLWSEPLSGTTADGEACKVLVLDTEGLGSLDKNEEYDARIFSLAALLCSTLIFNSMGTIDEKTISRLSFIASLTKHIRAQVGDSATSTLSRFFPSLIWVLRDFALALTDEYGDEKDASEYLEESLVAKDGFSAEIAESNHTRGILRSFFPRRDCVTLVRPIDEEKLLQTLTEQPWESLRAEFRSGLDALKAKVLDGGATIKCVEGRRLDGAMLADLAAAYVVVLSGGGAGEGDGEGGAGGGMPTILSAWESVCSAQCRRAASAARAAFRGALDAAKATLPQRPAALDATLRAMRATHLATFDRDAAGSAVAAARAKLADEMCALGSRLAADNAEQAKAHCGALLARLHAAGPAARCDEGAGGAPYGSAREFMEGDYAALRAAYLRAGFGETLEAQLGAYLRTTVERISARVVAAAEREAESRVDAIELAVHDAETAAAAATATKAVLAAELSRLDSEAASTKSQLMADEARLASEEGAAAALRDEMEVETRRRADVAAKLAAVQAAHADLASQVVALEERLANTQGDVAAAMARKVAAEVEHDRLTREHECK